MESTEVVGQGCAGPSGTLMLRRTLASIAALVAGVSFRLGEIEGIFVLWLPTVLLGLAAIAVHLRPLGFQLFARAVLWANLVLAVLLAISHGGSDAVLGTWLGATTGPALLLLGRSGVDDAAGAGSFAPVALRGTLLATMCMALADAQSFLLFGGLGLSGEKAYALGWLFAVGVALLVAVYGLFRLRAWGVLLNFAANAVVLVGMLIQRDLPDSLRLVFGAVAVIQVVLGLRIIAAFRLGATPSPPSLPRRTWALSAAVVVALTAIALSGRIIH